MSLSRLKLYNWTLRYLLCGLVALVVLLPLVAVLINGLKTAGELLNDPFSLPREFHWENYTSILTANSFWQQQLNSLTVTVATTVLVLAVSSMAAFIFARISFPGREWLFNFYTLGLLFPLAVAILPIYLSLRQLNLLDNLLGVILPQVAFGLPLNVIILRNFFTAVPVELEDAAYIDGCTPAGFFWRILPPLARPALATVAMLTIVSSWNGFLLPLLVLNKPELQTLPLGVMQFQGEYSSNWALIMAFVTLTLIPAIIFYLLAERHLIAGLTAGAIKG